MSQKFLPGVDPPPPRTRKAATWICWKCDRRQPFLGFDKRQRICGECQERPPIEPLLDALRTHYKHVPRRLLTLLRLALGLDGRP